MRSPIGFNADEGDDPICNGLACSLVFGILVFTLFTLVVIPFLYYMAWGNRLGPIL